MLSLKRLSASHLRDRWYVCVALAVLAAGTGACSAPSPSLIDRLHPCTGSEGPADALCGTLSVFENRDARAGRRIDLWIVLLRSLASVREPDPLVFLAGGPGQGAAQLAAEVHDIFRRVQRTRDIVLVDQRGTGRSNPLNCRSESSSLGELTERSEAALARLRRCLDGYDADVRLYTTDIAMDDLDEVRRALGYERVNLYGGSYGTRAALVYVRRHGAHVRSMVLDGVAPTDMRLPLFTARDAQRALDKLLADCEADAACRQRFPGLASRIRALIAGLDRKRQHVRIVHPRTGVPQEVDVDARLVASVLFTALYSPLTASIVPTLVENAERGDFQGLFALALAGQAAGQNMSIGMQLSVLCSEDAAHVTADQLARATEGTMFGPHLVGGQLDACAMWPKRTMEPAYYEPVASDVPALVLSGEIDPVTPPTWAAGVVQHLSHGRHIAVPATGHGVVSTPCGNRLVSDFIEAGTADRLDTSCVDAVRRPPFFVTPAGPMLTPPHHEDP